MNVISGLGDYYVSGDEPEKCLSGKSPMQATITINEPMQYKFGSYVNHQQATKNGNNSKQRTLDPDIKTGMNIGQIGPNHFKFIDEPPDTSQSLMPEKMMETELVECVPETHQGQEVEMQRNPQ